MSQSKKMLKRKAEMLASQGLTIEEIADILGIKPEKVEELLNEADSKIAEEYEKRTLQMLVGEAKARAEEDIEKFFALGKQIYERFSEIAKSYGFDDVYEFIEDIYDFWYNNKDDIEALKAENIKLRVKLQKLKRDLDILRKIKGPEIERILRIKKEIEEAKMLMMAKIVKKMVGGE